MTGGFAAVCSICFLMAVFCRLTPDAVAAPPQRIVSLDLCTDWQLARHADRLGKTRIAALSPAFRRLLPPDLRPQDFPTHAQEAESILAFAPDLVLTGAGNARLLRTHLQRLGVRVEILPLPRTLAEVVASERHFSALLGLAPPSPPEITTPAPALNTNAPRLLLFGANGIGTGRDTLEDEMLRQAGWRNYLAVSGYVRVDLEQLALDPPDAIVWSAPAGAALANAPLTHPLLRRILPAARIWQTDTWPWQCPGTATWDLLAALRFWRATLPERTVRPPLTRGGLGRGWRQWGKPPGFDVRTASKNPPRSPLVRGEDSLASAAPDTP